MTSRNPRTEHIRNSTHCRDRIPPLNIYGEIMASAQYEARRNAGLCGQCGAPAQANMKLMSAVRDRIARESGQTLARVSTMSSCQKCGEQQCGATTSARPPRSRGAVRAKTTTIGNALRRGCVRVIPAHPPGPARSHVMLAGLRKHDDSAARRDKWKQDPDCWNQCGKPNDSHRYVLCSKYRGSWPGLAAKYQARREQTWPIFLPALAETNQ